MPPSQPQISNRINAPQAFFGTMLGVWYAGITRDILTATSSNFSESIPLELVKVCYIFASLILLANFIILLINFQTKVYNFPEIINAQPLNFNKLIEITFSLGKKLLWVTLSFWGFLLVTAILFSSQIDKLLIIFGAIQPIIWILLEIWISWAPYYQDEKEKAKNT